MYAISSRCRRALTGTATRPACQMREQRLEVLGPVAHHDGHPVAGVQPEPVSQPAGDGCHSCGERGPVRLDVLSDRECWAVGPAAAVAFDPHCQVHLDPRLRVGRRPTGDADDLELVHRCERFVAVLDEQFGQAVGERLGLFGRAVPRPPQPRPTTHQSFDQSSRSQCSIARVARGSCSRLRSR